MFRLESQLGLGSLCCRNLLLLATVIQCLVFVADTSAQTPTITRIDPAGLKIGDQTTLTIRGANISDDANVLFEPATNVQRLDSGDANLARFEITLPSDFATGLYPLWIVNPQGISNRFLVGVDPCQQVTQIPEVVELPIAWSGRISGANVVSLPIEAESGDEILIDVQSVRLGANCRPVIRVLDQNGTQVDAANPSRRFGGDSQCLFRPTESGTYEIQVHDVLYRAGGNSPFRLCVGSFKPAHFAFPFGVQVNPPTSLTIHETFEQGSTSVLEIGQRLGYSGYENWYPLLSSQLSETLGAAPKIWLGEAPELVEGVHEPNVGQPIGAAPLGISGMLTEGENVDRYQVDVIPGGRYRCELWAQRMGTGLDGILVIRGANNQELGRMDDRPGTTDPVVDVSIPEGTNQVTVEVYNLDRSIGPHTRYRLSVSDLSIGEVVPRLSFESIVVPRDGRKVITIPLGRSGYQGGLTAEALGLAPHWTITGSHVSAVSNQALLTIESDHEPAAQVVQLGFRGDDPTSMQRHVSARLARRDIPAYLQQQFPWLGSDIPVSIGPSAQLQVDWLKSPSESQGWNGGQVAFQVSTNAASDLEGPLRLRLETSQIMPKKTIKVDNQDQQVDDVERALRLAAPVTITADQTEATGQIVIPVDLPAGDWSVALVAERLNADMSQVIASSSTPVAYVQTRPAIRIELGEQAQPINTMPGESVTITGVVNRLNGFAEPVTLAVSGLPVGFVAQPVTLAPDAPGEFSLTINVPDSAEAADIAGVQVVASTPAESSVPAATKSAGFALKINASN